MQIKNKGVTAALTYFKIVAFAVLLAFNYQLFIVQNGFAPAGLNGIATMIQYKTGFSIGYMALIINVPMCIFAYFFIDKKFAKRSLTFCATYSFCFLLLQNLGLETLQYNAGGHDTIFPVILSGVISGIVQGVCFKTNSSTGGTDIVSKYISKKRPQFNFFKVTFILNAAVAAASFFVYAQYDANGNLLFDYKPVCLCVMYCFILSFVGDYIIKGTKRALEVTIITTRAAEIMADITQYLHHSSTKIVAQGSFSGQERDVLICVINKHQMIELNNILSGYDNTFAFCETVNETYGNFKNIK